MFGQVQQQPVIDIHFSDILAPNIHLTTLVIDWGNNQQQFVLNKIESQ